MIWPLTKENEILTYLLFMVMKSDEDVSAYPGTLAAARRPDAALVKNLKSEAEGSGKGPKGGVFSLFEDMRGTAVRSRGSVKGVDAHVPLDAIGSVSLYRARATTGYDECLRTPNSQLRGN